MARSKTKFLLAALATAVGVGFAAVHAAEWPNLPASGREATVWDPAPRWPTIDDARLAKPNIEPGPQWPSVSTAQAEVTGAVARSTPAQSFLAAGPPRLSPFEFEIGGRYWYSYGDTRFDFTNGNPLAGTPTSSLYWYDTQGQSGEIFARLDHVPSGLFAKGVAGAGILRDGTIVDRDYFVGQVKFSDTTSDITGSDFRYGIVDIGWAFAVPKAGVRLGVFAGYHFWRSQMTASGLVCNADNVGGFFCGPVGSLQVPSDVAVFVYEPTWHALRIGLDARFEIVPRWTLTGEVVIVPYATLENKDSHLLRQSMADLGPAPNVIARSTRGFGGAAEVFINYAVSPNLEVGLGGRYWGMVTDRGSVQFGPDFATFYALDRFDQQRYGLLVQVKGKF